MKGQTIVLRGKLLSAALIVLVLCTSGCFRLMKTEGGGMTRFEPPRLINEADIALVAGYRIEAVATGLTFPTGIAFDDYGRGHVTESGYSYGEVWLTPRLLRIDAAGNHSVVAEGSNPPWNGVTYHQGAFYIAGGHGEPGQILRVDSAGGIEVLVDSLPSMGDHHTNGPVVGPDGWLYFGQGTATNSGVVGVDNYEYGWLQRYPEFHDIPCEDVVLAGRNFTTETPSRTAAINVW